MHFTLLLFHLIKMSLAHDKHNDENWWLDMQTLTHSDSLLCHQPGKFQAKTFLTISNKGIAFQGGTHTWGWQLGERLKRRERMDLNNMEYSGRYIWCKYQKITIKNENMIESKYSWNSESLKKKGEIKYHYTAPSLHTVILNTSLPNLRRKALVDLLSVFFHLWNFLGGWLLPSYPLKLAPSLTLTLSELYQFPSCVSAVSACYR